MSILVCLMRCVWFQDRNYTVHLNHTSLLKAILLHSGVPEDKLTQASNILCDSMVRHTHTHTHTHSSETWLCVFSFPWGSGLKFNASIRWTLRAKRSRKSLLMHFKVDSNPLLVMIVIKPNNLNIYIIIIITINDYYC